MERKTQTLLSRRKKYVPSPDWTLDLTNFNRGHKEYPERYWKGEAKVPVSKITKPENYPNPVDDRQVWRIILDFYPEGWEPIMVDEYYRLRDGQHRLKAAQQAGLEYIDVIIIPEAFEKYGKFWA
jgi:ParB-like nuclease domain